MGIPRISSRLGLRTHIGVFAAFLLLFSASSAMTYWSRIAVLGEVDAPFRQDLRILKMLPRLRAVIRQVDLLARAGQWNGAKPWVSREARDLCLDLVKEAHGARLGALLPEFQKKMELFLAEPEAASSRDRVLELDGLIYIIVRGTASELQELRDLSEEASLRRFFAHTAVEFSGALLIALYLYYFVVSPVLRVERAAMEWKLGQPWTGGVAHAIPEIQNLLVRFSELSGRVNAQFGREKELNEFKTKLVSLVSHEFGNALTVIKNATFLLEEKSSAEELKGKEPFYRMIESNANMLNGAINNLLSISRLEAGKLAVNFTQTKADELLRGAIERLDILAAKKRLQVSLELPDALAPIKADPATLSLVIGNLLSNAIKYTPDKGRIVVGVKKEPDGPGRYRFYVRDTGIGIAKEDRDRILGGYYRTERGNKLTTKGFGIGLSLARQLIEAHGSALDLESAPGKGSTFSFVLPVWPADA